MAIHQQLLRCIDDIPFRLSSNLTPPPVVILPIAFHHTSTQDVLLNCQYDFSLESVVLRESAERYEAKMRSLAVSIHRADESLKTETSNPAELTANSDSSNCGAELEYGKIENSELDGAQPYQSSIPRSETIGTGTPLQPAKTPVRVSDDGILLPTPVSQQIAPKTTKPSVASSKQSWTEFESTEDVFDRLELQTINDMKELQTVLQPAPGVNATGQALQTHS